MKMTDQIHCVFATQTLGAHPSVEVQHPQIAESRHKSIVFLVC